jgi:hypothetical protein
MWDKLTSRKFLSTVCAVLGAITGAVSGALSWGEAIDAAVIVIGAYSIGEGIADSGHHAGESN